LDFFGVVGLQPPWLRMVLTKQMPAFAFVATATANGNNLPNGVTTALASMASIFKHSGGGAGF
jgi:hypothetical protein